MGHWKKNSGTAHDIYQEVTDQIITALEQGTVPWRQDWTSHDTAPMNVTTGRRYRGINRLLLNLIQLNAYGEDPRWCSYRQAAARGWQVRRGERGTRIVFYKRMQKREVEGLEPDKSYFFLLRFSTVFHASQIDGIPAFIPPTAREVTWRTPEALDVIVANSGAEIRYGGGQPCYAPLDDRIYMPRRDAFASPEAFAQTLAHELSHWAYAKPRLDLSERGRFGSRAYSKEELRVEIAASQLCATLGLPVDTDNTAAYLRSWIEGLRNDKREIFAAAADAQRIADYLLAFHPEYAASLDSGVADDDEPDANSDAQAAA